MAVPNDDGSIPPVPVEPDGVPEATGLEVPTPAPPVDAQAPTLPSVPNADGSTSPILESPDGVA